jgi:hypothetical protein
LKFILHINTSENASTLLLRAKLNLPNSMETPLGWKKDRGKF